MSGGGTSCQRVDDVLWAAVADPSRRRVLDLLVTLGESTPTGLASQLPFTRQAVTKHLAVLDRAGLVSGHRHGREVRYVVRADGLDSASQAIARVAELWDKRLEAIREIAKPEHIDSSASA